MRLRLALWALLCLAVVLATRSLVYALAPASLRLAALAGNRIGPDLTVPLLGSLVLAAAFAAASLGLAVLAVRERMLLEGRRLVRPPRLAPGRLAVRSLALFAASSLAFALLESTIHWRQGLGWHGLSCLLGPVHRDAFPLLAALSLVAVAAHGALEHLLAWARRVAAQLAARLPDLEAPARGAQRDQTLRRRHVAGATSARGPPLLRPVRS